MTREQRKAKAEALRGNERRTPANAERFELRETSDGNLNFSGYASVTDYRYDMGWYHETIRSGVFQDALAERPDVQLLVNHQGEPLARTTSGTLSLTADSRGLYAQATLDPEDPDVASLARKAARGDISEMSFAFCGAVSDWDEDYTERSITKLTLHRGDVSAVNYGANPATSFALRNLLDFLDHFINPTDEELEELRDSFGPKQIEQVRATLERLAPTNSVELEPPAPPAVHDLDLFRARQFQLAVARRRNT